MNMPDSVSSETGTSPHAKPPRPPLVLHVGVIGHRPDRKKRPDADPGTIQRMVREVLTLIGDAFRGVAEVRGELFAPREAAPANPLTGCRIVTSLAEGVDQWAARVALELGWELQAPLPFWRDEYGKDFAGRARDEYCELLDQATAVFELDGDRERAPESYQAAGRLVIQQTDVLIAVWDGREAMGRGGTGQMVREALQEGVPVVWIPWEGPEDGWRLLRDPNWRLVEQPEDLDGDDARLTELIRFLLIPPDLCLDAGREAPDCLRSTYYNELEPKRSLIVGFWPFLRRAILRKPARWETTVQSFAEATRASWEEERNQVGEYGNRDTNQGRQPSALQNMMESADRHFFWHYAWANQLSRFYAGLYRGAFMLNYILGAVAVLCALLAVPWLVHGGEGEWVTITAELVVIGSIIVITARGRRNRWHERWIEYRTLAERLRVSRFLILLGGWRQNVAMPGYLQGYGDPASTWVYWHYRAVERGFGLPNARVDEARLQAIKLVLQNMLIYGQISYHADNATSLRKVDARLHRLGDIFFMATFLFCATHLALILFGGDLPWWASPLLISLNALLPTCGAAAAAIRGQGEFQRIARRSEGMKDELTRLRDRLSAIAARDGGLKSQDLRRAVERVVHLMLNETLDWRIVFQDRPLVFPS